MEVNIEKVSGKSLVVSKAGVNGFSVVKGFYNVSFKDSSIEELVFIVNKPDIMINIVSCPDNKVRILCFNHILQPPERRAHRNVTSPIIAPEPCPCLPLSFPLFLSAA